MSMKLEGSVDSQARLAWRDIAHGLVLWPLWGKLGLNDILQRYRRSLLGPLWLTASMAIMVISLGLLYAQIFRMDLHEFLPYLCVGLLVWGFIGSVLGEAGGLFTGAESYIKQIRLPYSVYVLRFVWSRIIIFGHNFLIYFGVIAYFQIWPGLTVLWFIPGVLLLALNGALTSLYIGMVSARFRDIPQIITSTLQIFFFATPIMWKPDQLGDKAYLIDFNPFYHLLEIVRAPLLGNVPLMENYLAVLAITAVNALLALALFIRFRARIAYWV